MKFYSNFQVIYIVLLIRNAVSEFYFCYKGPHRILDVDCPGGFFFKKPLVVTCTSPYVQETGVNSTVWGQSVCINNIKFFDEPSTPNVANNPEASSGRNLFQFIASKFGSTYTAKEQSISHCRDECFAEWEDLYANATSNSTEEEFDDKIPPASENITQFQLEQNQKLFTELIDEDDANPSPDPLAENYNANGFIRLYKLLAKSMRITIQSCDGYVDASFYSQVLKAMMSLLDKSNNTQKDIGIEEYKRIDAALDECAQNKTGANKGFTLVGPKCNNLNTVEGTKYGNSSTVIPYKLKPKSFRWYAPSDTKTGPKYDPIVEAAWDAVDFIHGFCFFSFKSDYNYHHIYTIAMQALFPKFPIQQRWVYPALVKNDGQFWNNVLQTTNIKQTMMNLDACALAAYHNTPFLFRLDKPFYPMPEDGNANIGEPEISNNASNGWQGNSEDFWAMYQEKGGWRSIFSEDKYTCLDTDDDEKRQQVYDDLKKDCP